MHNIKYIGSQRTQLYWNHHQNIFKIKIIRICSLYALNTMRVLKTTVLVKWWGAEMVCQDVHHDCNIIWKHLCFLLVTKLQVPLIRLCFIAYTIIERNATVLLQMSENKVAISFPSKFIHPLNWELLPWFITILHTFICMWHSITDAEPSESSQYLSLGIRMGMASSIQFPWPRENQPITSES